MTARELLSCMSRDESPGKAPIAAFMRGLADGTVSDAPEGASVMEALRETSADTRLSEVLAALVGVLLVRAGQAATAGEGWVAILRTIATDAAAERFGKMVAAMGNSVQISESWRSHLPTSGKARAIMATQDGWFAAIDGRAMGEAAATLDGRHAGGIADSAAESSRVRRIGTRVARGGVLARVHPGGAGALELGALYRIGCKPPALRALFPGDVS